MIPFGTLFNIVTVIIGSLIGLVFKQKINSDLNKKIFFVMGLFTLVLGISMAVKSSDFLLMFISIIIGTIFGEYYQIDYLINQKTTQLKQIINIQSDNFSDGMVTAFLLFCIGSMTIVGAIEEGLGNSLDILYTKSVMDGISSIILASTFGVGVLFSIFPMFLFQGGITILVFYYSDFIPLELIDHISSLGGVLILAIGFKILGYKKINPTNMLPSLVVLVFLFIFKSII